MTVANLHLLILLANFILNRIIPPPERLEQEKKWRKFT